LATVDHQDSGFPEETTSYAYNGNDELTSQTSNLSGTTTFGYDANGSQLTSTNGSNVTGYGYDLRNKMTGVSQGSTTVASYVYDDAGNRVRETTGGSTTYYLTATDNPTGYAQPLEEKSSSSSAPSRTYILGDRALAQADAAGNVTYLLTDGHGSTGLLTNSAGTLTAAFNYDAFGNALNFTPVSAATPFLFGGDGIYDGASGLTFHGSGRQSSNILGRFVTKDDQFYTVNFDPITGNLYLLDNANPVNRSDPSGHIAGDGFDDLEGDAAELAWEDQYNAQEAELGQSARGEAQDVVSELEMIEDNEAILAEDIGDGYSKETFRADLLDLTEGEHFYDDPELEIEDLQAHHVFPQEFEGEFERAGIDIHDPQYGSWVEANEHGQYAGEYNDAWEEFFRDTPNPTPDEILRFGVEVMESVYELPVIYDNPYLI
jgi:YD repeat-containing protein